VKAIRASGGNATIDLVKNAFVNEADNYFGASGNTQLDENGDRAFGNYDFWAVKADSTGYSWKRVARYNSLNDLIIRVIE
jgi:ABC-type branched-subunit amino acid transport system substrate-binding protein